MSVLDVAGNVSNLSQRIEPLIKPYFQQLGLELTRFVITSVSMPDEVTAHYDRITNMNMVKDMDRYTQFNTATAIGQPGTAANEATQTAMMMGMMMNQLGKKPEADTGNDAVGRLQKLKTLFEAGLIDEAEFKTKKAEILEKL